MAGNFTKPSSTDLYTDVLTLIRENQTELAKMLDGSTAVSIPSGAKRWNTANNRFEKFDGSTWTALIPEATQSAPGFLSAADKTKIDILKTGSSTDKQTSMTDATAGRLLINGAFGLAGATSPASLTNAGDLDAIVNTSVYSIPTANAVTVGAPSDSGGTVFTIRWGTTYATQHYFTVAGGVKSFSRQCSAGVWSAWVENLHTGNLTNAHIPVDATHRWATDALITAWNAAKTHADSAHAPSTAQKNSDITKAEIEAKLTGAITTHSHAVTGLPLTGGTLTGGITIQTTSPQIRMYDTDWGSRYIHCDGGFIGFLSNAGGWVMHCSDGGNLYAAGQIQAGNAVLYTDGDMWLPWANASLANMFGSKVSVDCSIVNIGSLCFAHNMTNSTVLPGNTIAGSSLRATSTTGYPSTVLAGTWRALGYGGAKWNVDSDTNYHGTLWQRIG